MRWGGEGGEGGGGGALYQKSSFPALNSAAAKVAYVPFAAHAESARKHSSARSDPNSSGGVRAAARSRRRGPGGSCGNGASIEMAVQPIETIAISK